METKVEKKVEAESHSFEKVVGYQRRQLTEADMKRMRLPKRFWTSEFKRIAQGQPKYAIEKYLRQMGSVISPGEPMRRGYGMVLWGENDTGKTSVASLVLKEARRRGFTCLFIRSAQYRSATIEHERFDDAHTVAQRCEDVDLLVLDDFGKESSSEYSTGGSERMFDDLIRGRCSNLKSTIITMNTNPKELEARYKLSFVRLISESFAILELVGESQRDIEKQQMIEFFEETADII